MNKNQLTSNIRRTLHDAEIVATALPLCPDIKLYLISPDNMLRSFDSDEVQTILHDTPYWIFCWAGGQALAHYITRHPSRFAGKSVLDFGSGSGVVAIAAAKANARKVIACDIDPYALDAVKANSALNHVHVDICAALEDISETIDIIIAADVLYDQENFCFIHRFLTAAPEILVADSRVNRIDIPPYRRVTEIRSATLPDLDDDEAHKNVAIYWAQGG